MRITILGTGTSTGLPMIGCECAVCTSPDPRDRRLRTSALIETDNGNILIDAGPDMRQQLLASGVQSLHGVVLTHEHQDHIGGIDDLRPLNYRMNAAITMYGLPRTLSAIQERYHYAFSLSSGGSSRPNVTLAPITAWQEFTVAEMSIMPLPITHGSLEILGYRIGKLAYITDASHISHEVCHAIHGVDTLIINALRDEPHPMHLSFNQALQYITTIAPRRAYLVHLTHGVRHADLLPRLPAHVQPAYDGLMIEVPA
ncbi:MAG: MBL fold metallo-hydrolase [Roseiflexaceae bacterium]|jgi:phosphoribosyl 1,2-cyclic phosphate phosphodiesterase|nr:MBL fold metallo-hydrolase [Chloroflexaceae bacterium]MCE2852449.1 MBL fold metallo-hydrolase [Chloroflexaceae bacterium]